MDAPPSCLFLRQGCEGDRRPNGQFLSYGKRIFKKFPLNFVAMQRGGVSTEEIKHIYKCLSSDGGRLLMMEIHPSLSLPHVVQRVKDAAQDVEAGRARLVSFENEITRTTETPCDSVYVPPLYATITVNIEGPDPDNPERAKKGVKYFSFYPKNCTRSIPPRSVGHRFFVSLHSTRLPRESLSYFNTMLVFEFCTNFNIASMPDICPLFFSNAPSLA